MTAVFVGISPILWLSVEESTFIEEEAEEEVVEEEWIIGSRGGVAVRRETESAEVATPSEKLMAE